MSPTAFPGAACSYRILSPMIFEHTTSHTPLKTPLYRDLWSVPAGAVRYWTLPHPKPWAPRPMPLFCISWQDFPRDYDVAAPL